MISQEDKKHSEIVKPLQGNFGRNEWAVLGTTCDNIKWLANDIIKNLSADYKCAYVDAEHSKSHRSETSGDKLLTDSFIEYIDKTDHRQIKLKSLSNPFQFRKLFSDADFILVNGNHYQAKSQVVVIDKVKEESLKRKIDWLTNVQLFLLANGEEMIFDFIKQSVPNWEKIPVYQFRDTDKIISFFKKEMKSALPKLNGLVLAGGKSLRMGTDKGKIKWHSTEQRYHLSQLLQTFCDEVFISCREEQQIEINTSFKTLTDIFIGLGPYGAILTAFRKQPDAAWLVIACDLPLIDEGSIQFLIDHRNPALIATAFQSPFDGLPEPLITIWEPKSYPVLLSFLSQGYSCPRKALINSDSNILKAPYPDVLMNVNTPEEFKRAEQILLQKQKSGNTSDITV